MSQFFYYLYQKIIIFINFIIVSDLELVFRATIKVVEWYNLGLSLGLPYYLLHTISHDYFTSQKCKHMMLTSWLETGSGSWSSLVEALRSPLLSEIVVAEEIMEYLINSGKYDTYLNV